MLFHEGKGQSVLTIMQSIKGAKTSVLSRRVNSISGKIFIAGNLSGSCPVWFGPEIMRMCKHWGKSAQDAELHHKCRVEDISSNSDYSPETDGGFQFLIATVQVKKKPFPTGHCCCRTTSNGGRTGWHVLVSRILSKPLQLRVKTNPISSIRPRRRSRLAINVVNIGAIQFEEILQCAAAAARI